MQEDLRTTLEQHKTIFKRKKKIFSTFYPAGLKLQVLTPARVTTEWEEPKVQDKAGVCMFCQTVFTLFGSQWKVISGIEAEDGMIRSIFEMDYSASRVGVGM